MECRVEPGMKPYFGCRFSLHPMADEFVPVILGAIEHLRRPGLELETDDVSTCVVGPIPDVFEALATCLAAAADSGTHVAMSATFSHG